MDSSIAIRYDSGPRNGEPVHFEPKLCHVINVLLPVMIEVTGHLSICLYMGAFKGIEICHCHPFSSQIPSPLNLKCG